MIGSRWWDCLVHASLSLSLCECVYACMHPALSQLCEISRIALNPRITQMTSKRQHGKLFFFKSKVKEPQEDMFTPKRRHDLFQNMF